MGLTNNLGRLADALTADASLNVGVGATPNASYKLDAAGTGRFQDNLLVSKNQNGNTNISISNTTSGTGSAAQLVLTSDASSGNFSYGKYSTATTASGIVLAKDAYIYNSGGGDIAIVNAFATGGIKFATQASTTAHLLISGRYVLQTNNANNQVAFEVTNLTSGASAYVEMTARSDTGSGSMSIGKYSTAKTPYKIIASKDAYFYNGGGSDIAIINDVVTGQIKLAAGGSSTSQLVLKSTGQLQINNYTSTSAFTGTAVGYLGFDASGNILSSGLIPANSTTAVNLYGLGTIQSSSTGTSYTANYQVRENSGGGGNTNEIYAPQLAFHWSSVVASSIMMEASGRMAIRNNPGTAYENFIAATISATGDVTAFASDERLKENIKNIPNALDKILSLNGVTFDWRDDALALGVNPTNKSNDIGVIAQQIQKVLPQAVRLAPFDNDGTNTSKSGEDYLTVQYEKLAPLFIEAIKEQQKQIEELKTIINGLTK